MPIGTRCAYAKSIREQKTLFCNVETQGQAPPAVIYRAVDSESRNYEDSAARSSLVECHALE